MPVVYFADPLAYGPFGQTKLHGTILILPPTIQEGNKYTYHHAIEAKSLLS